MSNANATTRQSSRWVSSAAGLHVSSHPLCGAIFVETVPAIVLHRAFQDPTSTENQRLINQIDFVNMPEAKIMLALQVRSTVGIRTVD